MIARLGHNALWVRRLLDIAVASGLLALALMTWSIHGTTPLLLIVFMTVGQGLSALSFLAFLAVILADLIRHRVIGPAAARADVAAPQGEGDKGDTG
jgi:hypothetical protein